MFRVQNRLLNTWSILLPIRLINLDTLSRFKRHWSSYVAFRTGYRILIGSFTDSVNKHRVQNRLTILFINSVIGSVQVNLCLTSSAQGRVYMAPTWTGKPRKLENFFQSGKSQGILNRLEKSGNFTQNTGKMREFYPKYWKIGEILASFYFYFSLIFNWSIFVK